MKFIIPANAVRQIDSENVEIDFVPTKLIREVQALAIDPYTHVYLDFGCFAVDSKPSESIRIYNNRVSDGGNHGTTESAFSEFERMSKPTAYVEKAADLRKKADELEKIAAEMTGGVK